MDSIKIFHGYITIFNYNTNSRKTYVKIMLNKPFIYIILIDF